MKPSPKERARRERRRSKQAERWERNRSRRGMLTTEAAAERWSAVLSDCGTPGRVFLNDVPSDYLPAEGRTDWILRLAHSHEGVTRCCISSVDRMSIPGLGCGRSIGRKSLGGGPSWEAALLDARKSIANGRAAR